MASTVIGFYDKEATAQQVIQELEGNGFSKNAIDQVTGSGGSSGVASKLLSAGAPQDEADLYAKGVEQGGTLVTVTADGKQAETAAGIMQSYDPIYVEALNEWVAGNRETSVDKSVEPVTGRLPSQASQSTANVDDMNIPIVEETLRVGKRDVSRGGVKVRSYVTETPVEEQIRLRDETIHVDRRTVDRAITSADGDLFQERSIELTETDEEAVVSKEARVVEEVLVRKDVEERVETVRDSVRRTNVDIQNIGTDVTMNGDFSRFDTDFRTHYDSSSFRSDYTYEQSQPAYRYGYALASDKRYKGSDWQAMEKDVQRDWEKGNKGTWEQFKDSVRYAWERARS